MKIPYRDTLLVNKIESFLDNLELNNLNVLKLSVLTTLLGKELARQNLSPNSFIGLLEQVVEKAKKA